MDMPLAEEIFIKVEKVSKTANELREYLKELIEKSGETEGEEHELFRNECMKQLSALDHFTNITDEYIKYCNALNTQCGPGTQDDPIIKKDVCKKF